MTTLKFCSKCENLMYIQQDKTHLYYQCKTCEHRVKAKQEDYKIYEQRFHSNTEQTVIANKFIIHDNTLPHLNSVTCINPKCSSNTDGEMFIKLHKMEMDEKSIEDINEWLSKQDLLIDKEVRVVNVSDEHVIVENILNTDRVSQKLIAQKWEKSKKPKKNVVFIKSDPVNLVYTYICVNCSAQWRNKT